MRIVELRYFGGLTEEEIADSLITSEHREARLEGGQSVALRRADRGKMMMKSERWQQINELLMRR